MADESKDDKAQREAEEFAAANPGPRSMVVPGNDLTGYIGVSPEYMNYANPTHKPYLTEAEAYQFTNLTDDQVLATRDRESDYENERPAVAEDTGFDFAANKEREEKERAEAEKKAEDDDENDSPKSSGSGDTEQGEQVPKPAGAVVRPPLGS